MLRVVFCDVDETAAGRGKHGEASLLHAGDGSHSYGTTAAVAQCEAAGVAWVFTSGRHRRALFEVSRAIGQSSFIFEAGAGIQFAPGEVQWLTGSWQPDGRTVHEQILASGAVRRLLARFRGALEFHDPWNEDREVSVLLRGRIDLAEARPMLAGDGLTVVDNGVIPSPPSGPLSQIRGVHAYHVTPQGVCKASAARAFLERRGVGPQDAIAVGDSAQDLELAEVVGRVYIVRNGVVADPALHERIAPMSNVTVTDADYGWGVCEALGAELRPTDPPR